MTSGDTIVAISSAVGSAARMIVRLSGPAALPIASSLAPEAPLEHAAARRTHVTFAGLRVPAWVYSFRNPHSYTGEDSAEFHIPGNPLLADMLLRELVDRGARLAEAGEFTARAYFNGRIDLIAAEGVAATIAAGNEAELQAARRLLAGELARRLAPAMDLVAETLALVEAAIDFVDEEDVSFLQSDELRDRISRADGTLRDLLQNSNRFERLAHEPAIVLAGRPNAGKSTLLNALAGHERAVTSPQAGTTRDALSADVPLRRGVVKLTDVAGLEDDETPAPHGLVPRSEALGGGREGEAPAEPRPSSDARLGGSLALPDFAAGSRDDGPADVIAAQMRRHALRAVESADLLVLVRDATDPRPALSLPRNPGLVVASKSDLLQGGSPGTNIAETSLTIAVSALTGNHLDALRDRLDRLAFGDAAAASASALALNARHVRSIAEAREALARAAGQVGGGATELLALELRDALDALGGVLGKVTPDDLLGRIFSAFCIGK